MHDNPCCGKWNLVTDVIEYKHSSAKFYLCREQEFYPVMNYLELQNINLTKNSTSWRQVHARYKPTR